MEDEEMQPVEDEAMDQASDDESDDSSEEDTAAKDQLFSELEQRVVMHFQTFRLSVSH